jgi:hypothetical protein
MARRRIATVVYGVFALSVGAFVVYSIAQVALVLFGSQTMAQAGPLAPDCASGLRSLMGAIDRGSAASENAADQDRAREAFTQALAPEWDRKDDVRGACEGDPEAFAETLQLERLLEHHAAKRAEEAGPLRKRLEARIALERRP